MTVESYLWKPREAPEHASHCHLSSIMMSNLSDQLFFFIISLPRKSQITRCSIFIAIHKNVFFWRCSALEHVLSFDSYSFNRNLTLEESLVHSWNHCIHFSLSTKQKESSKNSYLMIQDRAHLESIRSTLLFPRILLRYSFNLNSCFPSKFIQKMMIDFLGQSEKSSIYSLYMILLQPQC